MRWWRWLAASVLASATASAAPRVAFDGLFRGKASWKLPCTYGSPDQRTPHGDLVCTVDRVVTAAATKRAHVTCTGQDGILGDILAWALEPRTLIATAKGLWSIDDDGPDGHGDVSKFSDEPPLLPVRATAGKRRRVDEPNAYSGMWFVTSAQGNSWCVAKTPWGWGGGLHIWEICVSPAGAITGVAGLKQELGTVELRCGNAPDPMDALQSIQQP